MTLFPGRKQLQAEDRYAGVAHGEQITIDTSRSGHLDDGSIAYPERVEQARRAWPEAKASDFEKIGRRRYRDRGSGIELVAVRGAPLLSIGQEETRGVSCFLIENGRIVVLRREDFEQPLLGAEGRVYGQRVSPASPGPATGVRIL